MAKDPTYPMYAQDFDMDTAFLSNEEIGVYIRLLNACWINNGLPSDLKKLSRICRITEKEFEEIWKEIRGKFYLKNGNFYNKKQEEVRQFRYKQKDNGSKGGRPKKEKEKNPNLTQPKTQKKANENLSNEIEIEIEIEDEKEEEKRKREKTENEHFLIDLEVLKKEVRNEFTWKETLVRNLKEVDPSFDMEAVENYLEIFFKTISNDGEEEKTIKDLKKHFSRWLNIQIDKKLKQKNHGKTDKSNREIFESAMASEIGRDFKFK